MSSLETRRTLDEDVLGGLSQMLPRRATKRPRPRTRYPGALKAGVRAPRLIVQRAAHRARPAASEAKGLRRRCDGAVPGRDRWLGSSVFSSPPPSRELRMGQPCARQAAACSAPATAGAWTAVARDTGRPAASRRRERESPAEAVAREGYATDASHPNERERARHETQVAATPSSPSTRTEVARSTSGSCGRCSRPWARSRPRRSSSR